MTAVLHDLSILVKSQYVDTIKTFSDLSKRLYSCIMEISEWYKRCNIVADRYFQESLKNNLRSKATFLNCWVTSENQEFTKMFQELSDTPVEVNENHLDALEEFVKDVYYPKRMTNRSLDDLRMENFYHHPRKVCINMHIMGAGLIVNVEIMYWCNIQKDINIITSTWHDCKRHPVVELRCG